MTIRKSNPGFLTDDELVSSFCVRTGEFESIVEMLRECTGSANPHQIVIGPRGSGKTSLLLRVAVEVQRDTELRSGFFPIVFAEESYEVSTAGEFWLVCLSRLANQVPHKEDVPNLHRTYEDLCTIQDDQILAERCLGALLDFSDREGKRLVLLVENLNMIFRDMADPDAGWRLRKILQTEPRIILLASATSRFDEIDNPDHALYDLFRILLLRPLDTNECAVLWEAVAGKCPPPETIRSLEILTGGSPRLIAIVARFGAERSFPELMDELLDLVDDHTEYFKGHIESLPAQERRVYLVLADLWKPATTKEIAVRTRLETSKCSAQLARLIERGVVQVSGGTARRKQYYLTERLYNIYYLLRRSRGPDSLIQDLIQFMESYYSGTELKDIGVHIAREAGSFDGEMKSLAQIALVQMIRLPVLAEYREELLAVIPEGFTEVFERDSVPSYVESKTRREDQRSENTNQQAELLAAKKIFDEAVALKNQNQLEDALAAFDEVVHRFGDSEMPVVLGLVAGSLVSKGFILGRLNRPEDALVTFDEVVHRFGDSELPAFRVATEDALLIKAHFEIECRQYKAAIETVGRVLDMCHAESLENRCLAHLIRAEATLANGDLSASERDIAAVLTILPDLNSLTKESLDVLMTFSIGIGPERMVELIQVSPSANLLLPLTTALEQELGHEPRVALEVAEVAEDIRRDLAKLRETQSDGVE